jgi:predicted tellurium resistance membrane protein TerC
VENIFTPETLIALVTLTALEIVLGIDNIIFISILVGRLPEELRQKARFIGLLLAMLTRILLLFSLTWVMGLIDPLFTLFGKEISGRDLILIGGGLFLLYKSTHEIHSNLEGMEGSDDPKIAASFAGVLTQIALLDIIFSLDSVITAVGLARHLWVMVTAVILAVGVMIFSAKSIGDFVDRHPTFKILALSFLMLIGVTLIADGFGAHVPKGYIYFSMAFAVAVEVINMRIRNKVAPVHLRKVLTEEE